MATIELQGVKQAPLIPSKEKRASIDSEIGGHENLKSVLIDEGGKGGLAEEQKVVDTITIIQSSGGDGNLF